MSSAHEVISALLDDQPFDRQQLADALDDPAGRALLIDLATLRRMVQPVESAPAIMVSSPAARSPWRVVAAAAMLFLAIGGGYLVGERQGATTSTEAPPPTRVVEAVPFVPSGGMR
jgi:hypothetical protein